MFGRFKRPPVAPATQPEATAPLFERLFEAVPDAMLAVDAQGRISRVNPQTTQLFGYTREELLGQPVELLVPQRLKLRHEGQRKGYQVRPHLRPMGKGFNLFGRRKDGTEFPVDIMLNPLELEGGLVTLAVVRDVSERQRAEQTLRERIALFERIFEFAPDAMLTVDATGKIARLNMQVERLFGYERGELLGAPLEKLIPERFRAAHTGHRAGYFATPRLRPMGAGVTLFGLRKDGREFPVDIMLSPLAIGDEQFALAVVRELRPAN